MTAEHASTTVTPDDAVGNEALEVVRDEQIANRYSTYQRVYMPALMRFRKKRMASFVDAHNPGADTSILDIGGTPHNWDIVNLPSEITLLNLPGESDPDHDTYTQIDGDARDLEYPDGHFDIAFSNSVIEHVGSFEDQREFATEIRRIANNLWVQTPAKHFWFEPHYLTPIVHWLPKKLRRRVGRNFTAWGLITRPSQELVDAKVEEIRLLTYKEFRQLFPDCEIRRERFLGWTKSYVAVRL